MILVIGEHRGGAVTRGTWEAIAAARAFSGGESVSLLLLADDVGAVSATVASADVDELLLVTHPLLATYTADAYCSALARVVSDLVPTLVLVSHSYQARDVVPRVAARLGASLVTDAIGIEGTARQPVIVRRMFHGKLEARVRPTAAGPLFVSLQSGVFEPASPRAAGRAPVRHLEIALDVSAVRQRPEPPTRDVGRRVDLGQAQRIVAVGRGIQAQEKIAVAEQLAETLGAELAASRPVCDSGWMAMDRQIGSSGQTVTPQLYVALGISGAVQHLVGMRGARTVVAINKDPLAPIFEVADDGIVGDLFEVVPALVSALRESQGHGA